MQFSKVEIVIAMAFGAMIGIAFVLGLCRAAGQSDRWMETHGPTDPCADDFATEPPSAQRKTAASNSQNSVSLWQVNPPLRKI